jgi:hypothetical protein
VDGRADTTGSGAGSERNRSRGARQRPRVGRWPHRPGHVLDAITPEPIEPVFPDTWRLLDDVQLLELPDPKWIIQDVLQHGGVGVIYAPPGARKTPMIAGMLTAITTGDEWLGHAVLHKGACVYVAVEDGTGFKMRTRAAKGAACAPSIVPSGFIRFRKPSICVTARPCGCSLSSCNPRSGLDLAPVASPTHGSGGRFALRRSAIGTRTGRISGLRTRSCHRRRRGGKFP